MINCRTYIDESGNTGPNLADKNQPFFVLVSVTIPQNQKEPESTIQSVFSQYKQANQEEFKTRNWIKSTYFRQPLSIIWDSITQNATDINVVILEKRYMEAALIVNNLFDGAYSDRQDFRWVNKRDLRLTTTEEYYNQLSDEDLEFAGKTLTQASHDSMEQLYNMVYAHSNHALLRNMLDSVHKHLDEMANDINSVLSDRPDLNTSVFHAPNITCFAQLGQMVVNQAKNKDYLTEIIFDSEPRLDGLCKYTYDIFQHINDVSIPGVIKLSSWKDIALSFTPSNSKLTPGLLAADVVASSIAYVLNHNVRNNEIPNNYETKVLSYIKQSFVDGHLWSIMSNKLNPLLL